MRARTIIAILVLAAGFSFAAFIVRRAIADSSPVISNVDIADVAATSTTVTWTTNANTDSYVDFSTDTNYCGVRNTGSLTTAHSVVIPNLVPGTTYYFRIRSTDSAGNQSYSGDYTFTTSSTVSSTVNLSNVPVAQQNLTAQALAAIQSVTNPQALAALEQAVQAQASANVNPPQILGNPVLDIGTDQVAVTWSTDVVANGTVSLSSDAAYQANPGQYAQQVQDPNPDSQSHAVTVYGLSPSTLYHYKVSSQGTLGTSGESKDLTFTTKSILPQILNPHFTAVSEHAATVNWATASPTAGTVEYTNGNTRQALSAGDPAFLVTHSVQLSNLAFQTRYSVVIEATDQAGDVVTSTPLYFVTVKNANPPVISQVNNDSTLYPGQDTTVQTVISWQTDEPAECGLSYVEGIVKTATDVVTTTPETGFVQNHVSVITNFAPATVYKYWITCADQDGNSTSSEDFVLLTPQQQKSILDIIISNFEGTFGWVNGITGGGSSGGSGGGGG
jgi:Purple acid Phosphatase, N-terminal domain